MSVLTLCNVPSFLVVVITRRKTFCLAVHTISFHWYLRWCHFLWNLSTDLSSETLYTQFWGDITSHASHLYLQRLLPPPLQNSQLRNTRTSKQTTKTHKIVEVFLSVFLFSLVTSFFANLQTATRPSIKKRKLKAENRALFSKNSTKFRPLWLYFTILKLSLSLSLFLYNWVVNWAKWSKEGDM